ncbi:MAG: hypothetical protein Q9181_008289 [Wetmoreana brouardii]
MKAMQRLVDYGAGVQVKDYYGRSPYEIARRSGNTEMARYLDRIGKSAVKLLSTQSTPVPSPELVEPDLASRKTFDSATTLLGSEEDAPGEQEEKIDCETRQPLKEYYLQTRPRYKYFNKYLRDLDRRKSLYTF